MFAVFKTGGKQYRVATEDVLQVDKIKGEPGEIVEFGEVLVVGGDSLTLGAPTVAGAIVAAEVLDQARGPKIIAFKKRRRKNSRRKRGHRQEFTLLRITEILTEGKRRTGLHRQGRGGRGRPLPPSRQRVRRQRKPRPRNRRARRETPARRSPGERSRQSREPPSPSRRRPSAKRSDTEVMLLSRIRGTQ
jgi:large subunit ribosomal protein L21